MRVVTNTLSTGLKVTRISKGMARIMFANGMAVTATPDLRGPVTAPDMTADSTGRTFDAVANEADYYAPTSAPVVWWTLDADRNEYIRATQK